ncbi:MAG: recombination protein O N-terminal domain-containing protein [Holosporales bacterium]|jgi:recombinational DNA repair protein (RecF pathway)|nr:recombination protein O N-terminal domain-containing protein [Holosporales bacterium]
MVVWDDRGIVISSRKHMDKYKIVDVFTIDHGRVSALVAISSYGSFSVFSKVDVEYESKHQNSIGFLKLQKETTSLAFSTCSADHIFVCHKICSLLSKSLPQMSPHRKLCGVVGYIADNIHKFSSNDVLTLYAYFEFSFIEDIGYGIDLNSQTCPKIWVTWKNFGFTPVVEKNEIERSLVLTNKIIKKYVLT